MTISAPTLYDDQKIFFDELRATIRAGYRCIFVRADTGYGKTVIFSYLTHGAAQKGNPVLITAHRKEIIKQISLSLAKFGVTHQIIAPADKIRQIKIAHFRAFGKSFVSPDALTMVGSVQTVVGRLPLVDATVARAGKGKTLITIFDEGHHLVKGTQWGDVMDHCEKHKPVCLPFSATPKRLDKKGLGVGFGGYAQIMIKAKPMKWLIENKRLSPYRVFAASESAKIDMTGAGHRAGEWKAEDVEERANKPRITGNAIEQWLKHAKGMRTLISCASIKHSKDVTREFNEAGISCVHIDGSMDDDERDAAIMDYANGKYIAMSQVSLVTEGFDLASIAQMDVTIDCLIDLAPSESLGKVAQLWGRVIRYALGKVAIILDLAGNVGSIVNGEFKPKHGMPADEREWDLEGEKKGERKNDESPDVPITSCPKCYAVFSPLDGIVAGRKSAARNGTEYAGPCCPMCDSVLPVRDRQIEVVDGSLEEITADQVAAAKKADRIQQGKARTKAELVASGKSEKKAYHIMNAREIKDRLIDSVIQAGADMPVYEIRKMKPKQLKEWLAELIEKQAALELS